MMSSVAMIDTSHVSISYPFGFAAYVGRSAKPSMVQTNATMMFAHRFILSFMIRVRKAINGWTRSRIASISSRSSVISSPCISPAMIWLIMPGSTNAITAPDRAASSENIHSAEIFILMSIGSVAYHLLVALLICRKSRCTEYHSSRQTVLTLAIKKARAYSKPGRENEGAS
jgi:hypothetical protein